MSAAARKRPRGASEAPEGIEPQVTLLVSPEQALDIGMALMRFAAEVATSGPEHTRYVILGEPGAAVQLIIVQDQAASGGKVH